ncbi:ATP-binding protein [Pseudonocardia lacus]|uniref:ATP-binding protein n=1 Tax=Pseudonocardia lacus TaxID=2835865 RepID=UPI0027E37DFF|nr:ATP-binding protein [Pseudonocardia lacus]
MSDQMGATADLGAANRLLQVRQHVADAATALREERDRATLFVAGRRRGDRDPLDEAVRRTDAAVARARAGIAEVDDIIDAPTRAALRQADSRFGQLSAIRTSVTGTALLLPGQVLQRYTFIVNRADGLDRAVVQQVQQAREPTTVGLADALVAVSSAAEAIELEHTVVGIPLIADAVTPDDRNAAAAADSTFIAAYVSYEIALPEGVEPVNFVTADANSARGAVRSAVLLGPTDGPITVSPAEWDEASYGARDVVLDAERRVVAALADAGAAAESRSTGLAWLNSAVLLLGLLLTATVVAVVTRSLTGSLRLLRASALDIAYERLPRAVNTMRAEGTSDATVEPVPLRSTDEVGQVARAFDVVHGEAVRLAGEAVRLAADQAALQASVNDMFANLSRRSTGLVDRQLRLIEQLEDHEEDPDQLADLVQLDHLAVRMRRTSQNLLVLAGTDTARPSTAPTPLADVLRAAVSEVERDDRIRLEAAPGATVLGHVINDLVHVLAELLDNATNFSPPDTPVVVRSSRAADGSVLIRIVDLGVGMKAGELADANRRVSTPSAVDVATSRRMGLFVVGRLAGRHGITVGLDSARTDGDGDGLTASVTLPARFVASDDDLDHPDRQPAWPARPAGGADPDAGDPDVAPLFDPGDESGSATAGWTEPDEWVAEPVAVVEASADRATPATDPFPVVVDHRSPRTTVEERTSTPILPSAVSAWFEAQHPAPAELPPDEPPDPPAEPVQHGPPTGEDPDRPLPTRVFATAADAGWRASAGAAAPRDRVETTAAGLPKRRPHARLVPGSAGTAVRTAEPPPRRDADDVRDRLASHQQGIRQGRRTPVRDDPEGQGGHPGTSEEGT